MKTRTKPKAKAKAKTPAPKDGPAKKNPDPKAGGKADPKAGKPDPKATGGKVPGKTDAGRATGNPGKTQTNNQTAAGTPAAKGPKQPSLPGVEANRTRAQKKAEELLDAEAQLAESMELVETRRDSLLHIMKETGEHTVKVLDASGNKYTYRIEQIEKLKRKKLG